MTITKFGPLISTVKFRLRFRFIGKIPTLRRENSTNFRLLDEFRFIGKSGSFMGPGSLQDTGFRHKVDPRSQPASAIKSRLLVAPAFATLSYADVGHANFSIHCILCTMNLLSSHLASYTTCHDALHLLHSHISETWGLDQPLYWY